MYHRKQKLGGKPKIEQINQTVRKNRQNVCLVQWIRKLSSASMSFVEFFNGRNGETISIINLICTLTVDSLMSAEYQRLSICIGRVQFNSDSLFVLLKDSQENDDFALDSTAVRCLVLSHVAYPKRFVTL